MEKPFSFLLVAKHYDNVFLFSRRDLGKLISFIWSLPFYIEYISLVPAVPYIMDIIEIAGFTDIKDILVII